MVAITLFLHVLGSIAARLFGTRTRTLLPAYAMSASVAPARQAEQDGERPLEDGSTAEGAHEEGSFLGE